MSIQGKYVERDEYWATLEDEEFLDAINHKIQRYYDFAQESGLYHLWRRSFLAYYGGDLNNETSLFESAKLAKEGQIGQITKGKINSYRNLVKHSVNLATANKNSLNAVATNTDLKSQAQAVLGSSLLEYYLKDKDVGKMNRTATELACVNAEGWIHAPWEPDEGEIYEVNDDGKPVFEGDLDVSAHGPLDVIRDTTLTNHKYKWLCLRKWVNKWDLIAEYPDLKEDILEACANDSFQAEHETLRFEITKGMSDKNESDDVPFYIFYHDRTKAMKHGRITIFLRNVILFDGKLPYRKIPLRPIMPDILHDSGFGYSPYWDLLGLQQASDNLFSSVLSNNMTFAKQYIWKRKGDNLDVTNLEGGLSLLTSEEMPQALQLTKSANETYKLIMDVIQHQETLSGISSTVRGRPEANLKSGAALALVVAQSIQFGSALEESYNRLLEDVGMTIINHLQDFSKTPRIALISGESNKPYLRTFQASDIMQIQRVTVQQTNALSKTISGRVEIANQIMSMPPPQAKTYMHVLNTGQLPQEMQTPTETMNIQAENEALQNGEEVQVIVTENHAEHITQHRLLVENPEAKKDPELVKRVLDHIQEHINQYRTIDPAVLAITGQQPLPPDNNPLTLMQQQMGLKPPQTQPMPGMQQAQGMQGPAQGMPQTAQVNPDLQAPEPVQGQPMPNQPNLPGTPEGTDPQTQANYAQFMNNL